MVRHKKTRRRAPVRLLPTDAYPESVDEAGRDRVDAHLREQQHTIPTKPGVYLNNEGERWVLDADGCWTDHRREKRPPEYTPILGIWGPWYEVVDGHPDREGT